MVNSQKAIGPESFRDKISTVDKEGKRIWLYPKKPSGKYTSARIMLSWIYLILFFSGPFLTIKGEPILLFNVLERKFIIFGTLFMPQDFHLFLLAMITFIIFIILFTIVYGRIFCGWMCPQTIFMEMVFRRIEYLIEGDWKSQQKLDKQGLDRIKLFKKILKHGIFLFISFLVANTFLAYIIGHEQLFALAKDPVTEHVAGFSSLLVFTGIFYWVFARFREQVCTTVCPYGRLQGVLLDKDSIVVAYDYKRGEPRNLVKKNEDRSAAGKGDCIDCNQCVNVCPTGIDIRNGTQLECINCTACIDVCDFMMEKVGLDKGLIRYASERNIAKGKKFKFTPRMAGYSAVLSVLLLSLTFLTAFRTDVESTILRAKGMLYQERPDGISNLYTYKIVNKTHNPLALDLRLLSHDGKIMLIGKKNIEVDAAGMAEGSFFILLPQEEISGVKTKIQVGVYADGKKMETVKATFMGPVN